MYDEDPTETRKYDERTLKNIGTIFHYVHDNQKL